MFALRAVAMETDKSSQSFLSENDFVNEINQDKKESKRLRKIEKYMQYSIEKQRQL
jgi:hypothetical protein